MLLLMSDKSKLMEEANMEICRLGDFSWFT